MHSPHFLGRQSSRRGFVRWSDLRFTFLFRGLSLDGKVFRFPFDFSSWILASLSNGSSRLVSFPTVRLLLLACLLLTPLVGFEAISSWDVDGCAGSVWTFVVFLSSRRISPVVFLVFLVGRLCRRLCNPYRSLSCPVPHAWLRSLPRGMDRRAGVEQARSSAWTKRKHEARGEEPMKLDPSRRRPKGRWACGSHVGSGTSSPPEEFLLCPRDGW